MFLYYKFQTLILFLYMGIISLQSGANSEFTDDKLVQNIAIQAFEQVLKKEAQSFLYGEEFRRLSWEELREVIIEYNKRAPKEKNINSGNYQKLYKNIPGAPSNPWTFYPDFKERGGWPALFGKPERPPFLTWEELRESIIEYNDRAPKKDQIKSSDTYNKFYKKISGAHSNPDKFYSDFKERGGWFALLGKPPPPPILPSWEKLRKAVIEYNREASEEKTIRSVKTYSKFHKNIPGAPSYYVLHKTYLKKNRKFSDLYRLTWEELRESIIEYNNKVPEEDQINFETYHIQKFYKNIPGAPSNVYRTYPDFKERGGWSALLGKTCLEAFTAQR